MWGIVTIVLLSGASALLWLSYGFMASYRMFGPSALPPLIHAAAAISTAVLAVIVIGQATLRFGFARLLRTDPTDLQRSLIFAALSFISVALVLAHFGFDPTTILTTSAIVTAIIGLSIQPMLGSLLSGLNVARVVRIGDGALVDGQQVEVVSLNWRSVIGRHADGGSVVLPNAQLANGSLVILPRDRSARAEITLEVPAGVPPHRLRKLVGSIVKEFPEVDPVKPVLVRPTAYEPSKPLSRYSVTFWVRHYGQRGYAENGVLERIWYVFQRENIISHDVGGEPAHVERPELLSAVATALRTAGASDADAAQLAARPEHAIEAGELLSYGAGERIVFPSRLAGRVGLLVDGELSEGADRREDFLSHEGWLERIEHLLAMHIGPYAEYAVREAAAGGVSANQVCQAVALEIDDPQMQTTFVRTVGPPSDVTQRSGFLFHLGSDESRRQTVFCAVEHALILMLPQRPRDADTSVKTKRAK